MNAFDKPLKKSYTLKTVFLFLREPMWQLVSLLGSRAMGIYESCQVGNEAALRRTFHVPRGCLSVDCKYVRRFP